MCFRGIKKESYAILVKVSKRSKKTKSAMFYNFADFAKIL